MATFPAKTNYAAGDVLTAAQMVDIGDQINALNGTVGKNKIINGDFGIWQRGTSYTFNPTVVGGTYGAADRWLYWHNGATAGTNTVSQQTFTPGAAPVAGYEGTFFQRISTTTIGTGQTVVDTWQRIENVRTLAGQTVTISFWVKSSGTFSLSTYLEQYFGVGGSATVTGSFTQSTGSTTTNWTRVTATGTLPSISGKTIGSNSSVILIIRFISPTNGATFDIWGVQLEAGNTATAFQTATGTLAGELQACQRYYWRQTAASGGSGSYLPGVAGNAISTTIVDFPLTHPTTMRVSPTSYEAGLPSVQAWRAGAGYSSGTFSLYVANPERSTIRYTHGSGVFTINDYCSWVSTGSGNFFLALNAEL